MNEQNKSKVNLQSANDGFSGITTANKKNTPERGFSGVVSANSNSGSKNNSSNSSQSTKTK